MKKTFREQLLKRADELSALTDLIESLGLNNTFVMTYCGNRTAKFVTRSGRAFATLENKIVPSETWLDRYRFSVRGRCGTTVQITLEANNG